MSDALLTPRDARRLLSAAVAELLRSAPASERPPLPPRRELEERAGAGDVDASLTLRVLALLEALPQRVASALAQERVDVVLADGSSMPLEETERVLGMKEDRRAHRALRESLDAALAPFRHFSITRNEDAPTRDVLRAFLVDTRPLRDAAREALAALGGEPLEDTASLARALDLPDEHGLFGDEQTRALVTAARDAARAPVDVGRFRAPRALAGVALDAAGRAKGPAFAWPPALRRFDRHVRTVEAAATALAWAHGAESGRAVALALAGAPCRRAIGTGRSEAERAGRIGAATAVLRARAAVALAALSSQEPDEARDALADALGVDPGRPLLAQLAAPSWVDVDAAADAQAWRWAPSHALALRDDFDESWPLRTEAWHQLTARGHEPAPEASIAAKAWREWAGEWL